MVKFKYETAPDKIYLVNDRDEPYNPLVSANDFWISNPLFLGEYVRRDMTAWKPIESIPRNFTRVLLGNIFSTSESWPKIAWADKDHIYSDNNVKFPTGNAIGSPTHWRFLPDNVKMN